MNTAEELRPKKRTLTEIIEDFRRVLHAIDDAEGEVTPDLEEALTAAEAALEDKVDRCLWVSREASAQAEVYAERAEALLGRAKVLKNQARRLEDYVYSALVSLRMQRVGTPNFVDTIANSSGAVVFDDSDKFLDDELAKTYLAFLDGSMPVLAPPSQLRYSAFVRVKYEIDKKAVSTAIKSDATVEGARIVKSTYLKVT